MAQDPDEHRLQEIRKWPELADELEARVAQRTAELIKANQVLSKQVQAQEQDIEALRKSERRYRMLFNSAQDGVLVLDTRGIVTEVSQGAESLYGYPAAHMIRRPIIEFITPASVRKFEDLFSKLRQLQTIDTELRILRRDGDTTDIWRKCSPLTDTEGRFEGVLVYDLDITRIKMLREQLIRSERLAATGQLAASIAHEVNSPLQGVIGLIQLLKKSYPHDVSLMNNLSMLEGAFDSIRATVKYLLDLNRPGTQEKQAVDINHIISKTVKLLRSYFLKNRITVKLQLDDQLELISGSPQELNQVLMNLINNAVEAVSGLTRRQIKQGEIEIKTYNRDNRVLIEVSDNGPGISEQDLDHIFAPFYTRKKKMGMGIGLSICHRIIQEHRGTLSAGNTPHSGVAFKIELPAVDADFR